MSRHEQTRNDRLIALLPRIESQARRYVLTYRPDLDPAEVAQEACLSYLERAGGNPAFLDRPDEEIARRVTLDGWNAARSQQPKGWQVSLEPKGSGVFLNTLAAAAPDPEEAAIKADLSVQVQETIANLELSTRGSKDTYLAIARGLMEGLSPGKVMDGLGVKRQNWSYYRRRLQRAFVALEAARGAP